MSKLKISGKLNPVQYKQMLDHLTKKKIKNPFIKADDIIVNKKPEVEEREIINAFMRRNPRKDLSVGGFVFKGIRNLYKGKKGLQVGRIEKELVRKYKDEGMDFIDAINKANNEAYAIVDGRKLDIVKDALQKTDIRSDDYIKLIDEEFRLEDPESYTFIKDMVKRGRDDLADKTRALRFPDWAEANFGENYQEVLVRNQARALKERSDEIDRMYPADDVDVGPSFVGEQQMVDEIDEMNKANLDEILKGRKKNADGGRAGMLKGGLLSKGITKALEQIKNMDETNVFSKLNPLGKAKTIRDALIDRIKGFKNIIKDLKKEGRPIDEIEDFKFEMDEAKDSLEKINEYIKNQPTNRTLQAQGGRIGFDDGGMLVQPGFGGTRQGYADKKYKRFKKTVNIGGTEYGIITKENDPNFGKYVYRGNKGNEYFDEIDDLKARIEKGGKGRKFTGYSKGYLAELEDIKEFVDNKGAKNIFLSDLIEKFGDVTKETSDEAVRDSTTEKKIKRAIGDDEYKKLIRGGQRKKTSAEKKKKFNKLIKDIYRGDEPIISLSSD